MLLTPLFLVAADKWWIPIYSTRSGPHLEEISEPQNAPVIIAGFGRYGQIIGRLLFANGITPTVLDFDSETVETVRKFGWRVFYGDATRLDLLRTAGAEQARVLVLAVDNMEQSLKIAELARENFPQLVIVARARNVRHYYALRDRGVSLIERETLDSAIMSGRSVLELMGWEKHHARNLALRFRNHTVKQLEDSVVDHEDQDKLIAIAKQARMQLEELFAQEREQLHQRTKVGWADASQRRRAEDAIAAALAAQAVLPSQHGALDGPSTQPPADGASRQAEDAL
jgi:glutathione-regulated potassium-efflux system ancillary protein KefC